MVGLIFLQSLLAVYCLSLFLSKLSGPGGIFSKLRGSVRGSVKEGLSCPICAGTWISGALCAYLWWQSLVPLELLPIYLFALAGGNAVIHQFDRK